MQYYTQQLTEDTGIGKIVSFETEQHPKKRENRVGTLTIQVLRKTQLLRAIEEIDSPTPSVIPAKMLIKCCNMAPVLTGVIQKDCAIVSRHTIALHKHINVYLGRQYMSDNSGSAGNGTGLTSLSDSLYVLGVEIAVGDAGSMTVSSSPWESVSTEPKHDVNSAWKGAGRVSKTGPALGSARGRGVSSNTQSSKSSTMVHIKFCRVEDVPLIMQACRVFFRQVDSAGGKVQIEFPRGQMPMWWRIENDPPFDFKKTRDDFHKVEVVEQFRERSGCHFNSCFRIDPVDIIFSSRTRTCDGMGWIPVIYVNFAKIVLFERHEVEELLKQRGTTETEHDTHNMNQE